MDGFGHKSLDKHKNSGRWVNKDLLLWPAAATKVWYNCRLSCR